MPCWRWRLFWSPGDFSFRCCNIALRFISGAKRLHPSEQHHSPTRPHAYTPTRLSWWTYMQAPRDNYTLTRRGWGDIIHLNATNTTGCFTEFFVQSLSALQTTMQTQHRRAWAHLKPCHTSIPPHPRRAHHQRALRQTCVSPRSVITGSVVTVCYQQLTGGQKFPPVGETNVRDGHVKKKKKKKKKKYKNPKIKGIFKACRKKKKKSGHRTTQARIPKKKRGVKKKEKRKKRKPLTTINKNIDITNTGLNCTIDNPNLLGMDREHGWHTPTD